jgi:tripartite-type tricarboxylate transporter receptor subunit TctC
MRCFAKRNIRHFVVTFFVLAAWPILAQLQQDFPARPIRVIVPLTAGSAADILARRLALKMNENWGQPVVVENRPGAGTTLGAGLVAKAVPDGYTLLTNSAAFAASAAIYPKLSYDSLKDFAPVSQIALAPIVVVVAPSLGVKSVKDLVALAKEKPGQITFGSAGVGSSTHFAGEQLKIAAGLNVCTCALQGTA